jgi:hypothetical protein
VDGLETVGLGCVVLGVGVVSGNMFYATDEDVVEQRSFVFIEHANGYKLVSSRDIEV